MANAIFKKGSCTKGELYETMRSWFLEGGWENISSNPTWTVAANDADVFYSPSKNGERNLIFNMRPTPINGAIASSIETSTANVMSYRLQDTYTPNATAGSNGTFGRTSLAWTAMYVYPATTAIGSDATVNYYYYSDLNRVIFALIWPGYSNNALVCYIGIPDENDIRAGINDSRGMMFGASAYAITTNGVLISNTPNKLATVNIPYTSTIYGWTLPGDPTLENEKTAYIPAFGAIGEGIRGFLSDLYVTPVAGMLIGDQFKIPEVGDSNALYTGIIATVASYNSFGQLGFALRTS